MVFVILCFGLGIVGGKAAELSSKSLSAFERYVQALEKKIEIELGDRSRFFQIDHLPEVQKKQAYETLKNGEIYIDQGKRTDVPDGIIHHWTGIGLIPQATLRETLSFLQDYDKHSRNYQPDVIASELISREGDRFLIRLRFLKKKVITAVLDTEHQVLYRTIDARHVASFASTTRISEVKEHGKPDEHLLPPGTGWGFLWKLNTYWRFAEKEEGVYIQCETISLTRDIPFAVSWIVGRFVNSIPRESLAFTLSRTRERFLELTRDPNRQKPASTP